MNIEGTEKAVSISLTNAEKKIVDEKETPKIADSAVASVDVPAVVEKTVTQPTAKKVAKKTAAVKKTAPKKSKATAKKSTPKKKKTAKKAVSKKKPTRSIKKKVSTQRKVRAARNQLNPIKYGPEPLKLTKRLSAGEIAALGGKRAAKKGVKKFSVSKKATRAEVKAIKAKKPVVAVAAPPTATTRLLTDIPKNTPPEIKELLMHNNLPHDAAILNTDRDTQRTSSKYSASDDIGLLKILNSHGWFIKDYKETNAHDSSKKQFKPYMAVYQNKPTTVPNEGHISIIQTSSRDGAEMLRMSTGIDRFCSDAHLILNSDEFPANQYRHKGLQPDFVNELFAKSALAQVQEIEERVKKYKGRTLTLKEMNAFAIEAALSRFPKESGIEANLDSLLSIKHSEDKGNTLWQILCRVHENLITGDDLYVKNENAQERKARPIFHIGRELKINHHIFNLADKLCK